jgi:hypothetical protein
MQKVPVLTIPELREANQIAIKRSYNRALDPDTLNTFLEDIEIGTRFPILLPIMHEYAKGKKVNPHIRCKIVLQVSSNEKNNIKADHIILDVDIDLFNNLETVEIPMMN